MDMMFTLAPARVFNYDAIRVNIFMDFPAGCPESYYKVITGCLRCLPDTLGLQQI